MNRYAKYKTVIFGLCIIIILQGLLLIRFWPKKKIMPTVYIKGKIAIVIDDWGYNLNNLHFLDEIKYPLNISVLPNLTFSTQVAQKVKQKGMELILHLPLEPESNKYVGLEQNTITTDMAAKQIREILLKDISHFPYIKGVSNHMGSKATRSAKTMRIIFQELEKKRLYFLDSLVSTDSVCQELAAEMELKFGKRDVFLDNEENTQYIKGQIEELMMQAKREGYAIGIGHDRTITLKVLKEVMPQLEKGGFKFVFVSELVK